LVTALDRHVVTKVDNAAYADDVAHMHEACFPNCEVYGTDTPDSHWWVVQFGSPKCVVAFAGLRVDGSMKVGYLCRAGVLQGHRGCGLQLKLIKTRIAYAKKIGMKTLVTDTVPGNYHSANNLIRAGFTLFNPATPWAGIEFSLFWRMEIN
jgi:hypothetical protein